MTSIEVKSPQKREIPKISATLSVTGLAGAILFLYAQHADLLWVRLLVKPIPVICMATWVYAQADVPHRWGVLAGLFFSVTGDAFLELRASGFGDDRLLFLGGLGEFLIAHLCYIVFFINRNDELHPLRLLPFLLWGGALFYWIYPNLGGMLIPVGVYTLVIVAMMWRAVCLEDEAGDSFSLSQTAAWGAILFGISDSLIALDLFSQSVPGIHYTIMATYWLGQWGIALSVRYTRF